MDRNDARHYAVYLQRRVDDFSDAEQPAPKWTERDRDAVREVLHEFRTLDHHNTLMAQALRANGLQIPGSTLDEDLDSDSAQWDDLAPNTHQEARPWWRFW